MEEEGSRRLSLSIQLSTGDDAPYVARAQWVVQWYCQRAYQAYTQYDGAAAVKEAMTDNSLVVAFWQSVRNDVEEWSVHGNDDDITRAQARDLEALWRYAWKWLPTMATQLNTERIGSVMKHAQFDNNSSATTSMRSEMSLNKAHVANMALLNCKKRRKLADHEMVDRAVRQVLEEEEAE